MGLFNSIKGAWNTVSDYLSGDDDDDYSYDSTALDQSYKDAQNYLSNVDTSRKSAQQLYSEGNEAAGQAAGNKAGIAKRQAKAAAMMNGAGKLASAVQGAQAAGDAVSEGYDSTVSNAANLAASQENASKNAQQALANQNASNALTYGTTKSNGVSAANQARAKSKSDRAKSLLELGSKALSSLV